MRRYLQFLFLGILIAVFAFVLTNKKEVRNFVQNDLGINKPCSKPLKYSIGNIDSGFNISAEEMKAEALKAENAWEKAASKNLFEYDPGAEFKINLIYDERQEMVDESQKLDEKLNTLKSQQELIASQYSQLSESLKKRVNAYKKSVEDYQSDVQEFNKDVSYWNSQRGAPEDEYNKLKDKKEELNNRYESLEKERKTINDLVTQSNALAAKENKIVGSYNASLNTYKSKYGGTREFEKGIFDGTAINIYEFQEKSDLEMTLMHEFGHYLGIGHTQNPASIMYPMIGEQNMDNPQLQPEDLQELKSVCQIK